MKKKQLIKELEDLITHIDVEVKHTPIEDTYDKGFNHAYVDISKKLRSILEES